MSLLISVVPRPGVPVQPGIPLPEDAKVVLHDDQAQDGKQRIGMPEVYPLYLSQYCPLTEAWQWFWFRQLVHSHTGYSHWDETRLGRTELYILKSKWASLTKSSEAFTNFKGTNEFRDYVRDENYGAGLPGQEPLVCCGNVVKVIDESLRLAGDWYTPIETLDGNRPPPPIEKINRLTAPHVVFCATNVAADKSDPKDWQPIVLPDGRYRVDPFPQLNEKDVLVPLRTNGREATTYQHDGVWYARNYIRTNRLEEVGGVVVPSPYYPQRAV